MRAAVDQPFDEEEFKQMQKITVEEMRARLEGLFGASDDQSAVADLQNFDGDSLRTVVRQRWGVEYDVQPQKRGERVYVQVRLCRALSWRALDAVNQLV